MTVSCQEAMVEAQVSDRIVMPASGASAATIESLRARLLSERAASKEARQQAHDIAKKVSELQTRLDAEIEYRKKAEAAMNEVLEVLRAKGLAMEHIMANTYLPSESSVSEGVAPTRVSKDGESDQSSGEEASSVQMEGKCGGSANSQASADDGALTEGSVMEHQEGSILEDSSVVKTQITQEDTSGSDTNEVEIESVNKDEEEGSSNEQIVFTDPSKAQHNESLLSTKEREEGDIEQSLESVCDAVREVNIQSIGAAGLIFANNSACLPSANQVDAHQEERVKATSGELLSGGQHVEARANEVLYPGHIEKPNGMPMLATHNFPSPKPKHAHPYFTNNGHPHEMPHMYADTVHNVSTGEASFLRGPVNFSNTAHQSQEHMSSKGGELGRYPQALISDAILSLVDDKNGKLGSILVALQLAKQQLNDEDQAASYVAEKFEAPLPIPFNGKPYPGFYEGVPYQPPYRLWNPERHNAAPIIHFPMSPTSDHEVSPFERRDGPRRSSSSSAYYMHGYGPYLQRKGELHLGNGITLYTD